MAEQGVNLPGGFGGLMRFNEEYPSIFNLPPTYVIIFVVLIIAFRITLSLFFS